MIYLASPYSHKNPDIQERRYEATCAATARLIKNGDCVFSPIVHGHVLAVKFKLKTDAETWKWYNTMIINRCNALWVLALPGYTKSFGVNYEINYAQERGLHVKVIMPTEEELQLVKE